MRREWIEIRKVSPGSNGGKSPSMRREWIEIQLDERKRRSCSESPSMRREWIEIALGLSELIVGNVSLHAEGVD